MIEAALAASAAMEAWLPGRLFHIGVVARDIDAAMTGLGRELGCGWRGGAPLRMTVCMNGSDREMSMRIAHSIDGPPHIELIEARPDSPWQVQKAIEVHHLCYWSQDALAACARVEQAGYKRILGRPGAPTGYFRNEAGQYLEIIDTALHDRLTGWIGGHRASTAVEKAAEE
ncbi:MAG: VOC family protein [Sphingobium sp.]